MLCNPSALISFMILTLIVGVNWVSAVKLEQNASKKAVLFSYYLPFAQISVHKRASGQRTFSIILILYNDFSFGLKRDQLSLLADQWMMNDVPITRLMCCVCILMNEMIEIKRIDWCSENEGTSLNSQWTAVLSSDLTPVLIFILLLSSNSSKLDTHKISVDCRLYCDIAFLINKSFNTNNSFCSSVVFMLCVDPSHKILPHHVLKPLFHLK